MTADNQNAASSTTAQKLAMLADILRDCAARGAHFATTVYDQDNYKKVQKVSLELLALATGQQLADLEPLRAPILSRPSPFAVGDAAIIDEAGKILLIRRADNGLWAMPGGALEVGESPAEGTVREALEETGVTCVPIAFVGVHDSRICGTPTRHHLYHFLFLCRPLTHIETVAIPTHSHETLEVAWFPEDALPHDLDPGHARRIPEAFRVWHGDPRAYFDP
jgi:ADP-ribose pyrophosphatase YjhB (NUDIX family)